ncbi:MAG TPA: hypothetical protein VGI87_11550 [Solirubrobacteraceae bacterium]
MPARPKHLGWIIAAVVLAAAIAFVLVTGMRPEYDPYGWLVWGRQTLHWNLDTNGAPSWKPVTYLFTLPFALFGRTQQFLWMFTAVAAAFAGAVFAGRIAWRLTGPAGGRVYAPVVAAVFAGLGILGIDGYWQLIVYANSDPMIVALCLGAIDCHLSGRPRMAFVLLVLASLGRPEAWLFTLVYAGWAWRAVPASRVLVVAGLAAIPLLWFGVSALTAKSVFRPGDLALNSVNVIHGNKLTGVLGRWIGLYSLPMQIAAGLAVVWAAVRRDRVALSLAGAAAAWVIIEIAFAYHGWSAVPRVLMEPGAVMIVLVGGALGRLLAAPPIVPRLARWAAALAVLVLIGTLVPTGVKRVKVARAEIAKRHRVGIKIDRLQAVIDRLGGPAKIKACGQPVTFVGFQSTLAWMIGLNVGNVGFHIGKAIDKGEPIVAFKPHLNGWQVRPYHTSARCTHQMRTDTSFT